MLVCLLFPSTSIEAVEPIPWQTLARAACAREGCDGTLLIAIGTWEADGKGAAAEGDDGLSHGRWQMLVTTAAGHLLGRRYRAREALTDEQYTRIEKMLHDDRIAATVAAMELAHCSRRNRRARSRLLCWNKGAGYAERVLPIYRRLKGER